MPNQRRLGRIFFILVALGLVGLGRVMSSPSFELIRGVDVAQLIATTGMCFGAGIMALVLTIRGSRSS